MAKENELMPDQFKERSVELGKVFRPAAPINQVDLFCGRQKQIFAVVDAINQPGQHVVLYGERGVGKTSLANQLFPNLRAGSRVILAPHINCDNGDNFASIWKKVFSEITIITEEKKIGFKPDIVKKTRTVLDDVTEPPTPDSVRRILSTIGEHVLLIVIIDEFDKVPSPKVRALFADTIKVLSDRASPVTLVIVGVADDVEELIEEHQSIERCLVQVQMPRMSREELEEIVAVGLEKLDMSIDADAIQEIAGISKGLPHYTHLISLHCGREALSEKTLCITQPHVKKAICTAIDAAQQTTKSSYNLAILSTKKNALYKYVLLACAMAETDDFGYFAPVDVREPLSRVMKRTYSIEAFARHLHAFTEESRGPILTKMDSRSRFRFVNPLMQPFILMKGLAEDLVTEDELGIKRDPKAEGKLF